MKWLRSSPRRSLRKNSKVLSENEAVQYTKAQGERCVVFRNHGSVYSCGFVMSVVQTKKLCGLSVLQSSCACETTKCSLKTTFTNFPERV